MVENDLGVRVDHADAEDKMTRGDKNFMVESFDGRLVLLVDKEVKVNVRRQKDAAVKRRCMASLACLPRGVVERRARDRGSFSSRRRGRV